MASALDRKKSIIFGLVGTLGCLAGWAVGEPFLAQIMPLVQQAPSLTTRPSAVPLTAASQVTVPPPALPEASKLVTAPAPPPLPPAHHGTGLPEGIFALRTVPDRAQIITRFGGNQESEKAVKEGLAWLARHQADDGHWSDAVKCEATPCVALTYPGDTKVAETGLPILAFQAGGHYYFNNQKYSQHVTKGLDWLVSQQGQDGRLFGSQPNDGHDSWYQHGIGTFALAEACAVALATNQKPADRRYLDAATRAVRFMEEHQYQGGGWQYALDSGYIGDTSVTGWQVLALKSAMEAKIDVSKETMAKVKKFFETCGDPNTGQTGYQGAGYGTDLTNAVGLIVQQFILKQPKSPMALKAIDLLKIRADQGIGRSGDFYTLYNCTLSMFLAGGDAWKQWNSHVRDEVIARQEHNGCPRGSWNFNYQRTLDTSWAILTLEVYYRYATEQAEQLPSLQLAVLAEVPAHPGLTTPLPVRIARDRVKGAIRLKLQGDLTGFSTTEVDADETQEIVTFDLKTETGALSGPRDVKVVATAADDAAITAEGKLVVNVKQKPPILRVSVSPEVTLLPGSQNVALVRVLRERLTSPIRLRCEGNLSGLSIANVDLADDKDEASLTLVADSAIEAGVREVQLIAESGDVKTQEKFQLHIKSVAPELRISVPPEVTVNAGTSNTVPILIGRDRFKGPVTVRAINETAGITLAQITIPEDKSEGEFKLSADKSASVGDHPLRIRAEAGTIQTEADLKIAVPPPPSFPWSLMLVIGLWTGLLATGLALALAAGQSWYLSKRIPRWQTILVLIGGGLLAGLVAGGIGQGLFSLLARAEIMPQLGFLVGWCLLGGLVGRGIGLFVPNLNGNMAALAGAVGGLGGAASFIGVSAVGDVAGRCVGAAILGLCLGLMVALIESAFRDAWLEVLYGTRETRTVNLGTEPIQIGGASSCTIWTRMDQPVALKFWIQDGQVMREDVPGNRSGKVAGGHREKVGALEIHVRTGKAAATAPQVVAPPVAPPPPVRKTEAATRTPPKTSPPAASAPSAATPPAPATPSTSNSPPTAQPAAANRAPQVTMQPAAKPVAPSRSIPPPPPPRGKGK